MLCSWSIVALYKNSCRYQGAWLPENYSVAGKTIDHLFYLLCWISAVIFIGTGIVIGWVLWRYDHRRQERALYFSHNFKLEMVWTVIPALILVFIAFYQMNAWATAKMQRPTDESGKHKAPIAEVTGRQFEWRIRYAGENGILYDQDDILTVNELHVPVDEDVVLVIKSEDVLHSFFLPNLRVKQDVVPGLKQLTWFRADRQGVYDIVCAELCGWGHYKMRGRLIVEPRDKYEKWLAEQYEAQQATEFTPASDEDE